MNSVIIGNNSVLMGQFQISNLKENTSKCHLLISPYQPVSVNFKGSIIKSSNCEKYM